jgi:hypothetical protein
MFSPGGEVYRAIVKSSNSTTGEIYVSLPHVMGETSYLPLSYVDRKAISGVWSVPTPGDMIIVASDDDQFSNVFWLKTTTGTHGGSA